MNFKNLATNFSINAILDKSALERKTFLDKMMDQRKETERLLEKLQGFALQDSIDKLNEQLQVLNTKIEQVMHTISFAPLGFVHISAAGQDFVMGDDNISDNPPHKVYFTYDFQLGQYDVTVEDYLSLMDTQLNYNDIKEPIVDISWFEVINYCNARSRFENLPIAFNEATFEVLDENGYVTKDITKVKGYRLMTETEYEYVAKGGRKNKQYGTSSGHLNETEAVYNTRKLAQVGTKPPVILDNGQKIYDICGNVWKWCLDSYDESFYIKDAVYTNPVNLKENSFRVLRGGSWITSVNQQFSSSFRNKCLADDHGTRRGFRLARTVPSEEHP